MENVKTDYAEKAGGVLIALLAAAMLLGGNAMVLTRLIGVSMPWADEVLRTCFIWTVFFGCAYQSKKGLVNITFLEDSLEKKNKRGYYLLKCIHSFVNAAFAAFCCWGALQHMLLQIRTGEKTTALGFPAALTTLGFFLGTGLWAVYEVLNAIGYIRRRKKQ